VSTAATCSSLAQAYLHYFEQLLQAADPPRTENVTIPYWDWIHAEATGKFPAAFSKEGLFEDDRDEEPEELPSETLTIVTGERSWAEFGGYPEGDPNGDYGRLERGPHNFKHPSFIGGKMANRDGGRGLGLLQLPLLHRPAVGRVAAPQRHAAADLPRPRPPRLPDLAEAHRG
jgi:hypothetical protein